MTSSPTVRRATTDDAEAFAACHLACWREAYADLWGSDRLEALDLDSMANRRRNEIESGLGDHWLSELDGQVVGIAIAGPSRDDNPPPGPAGERELYAIYVREEFKGKGLADDLLEAAVGNGPASLWVYRDNPRASRFYVNHNFIPDGEDRTDSLGILEIRMVRN
ncbi:GNAT family N-acetyltransferase [Nakamurella flava]|uniref:GNAT family N-acetyltransferase n=1 Tax=Nakamurella flava TaxID=2576308 RepID=A0A4U6QL16_9ACTN|nr:GNAT family N-acetyltransferase [Nakamurella flava]TKV61194.1 GNAT family N-acetyltransferase [Nakamurella flava]